MQIGALNKRVGIENPTRVADTYGAWTVTWSTKATVWAAIWPISAAETVQAAAPGLLITHRIRIRYRDDVEASWRLLHDGRYFNIVSIVNPSTGNVWLDLLCKEIS